MPRVDRSHKSLQISADRARPRDKVILSGSIGDHGMAIMSQRENLDFEGIIESDTAQLPGLLSEMLQASQEIHCLRDPTRGGLGRRNKLPAMVFLCIVLRLC
jgi:hydrogenase expression/formation protein HypE